MNVAQSSTRSKPGGTSRRAGRQRPRLTHGWESGVAVYDTLFVELAARTGCPLLTFDNVLLKPSPDIAIRPRDLSEG